MPTMARAAVLHAFNEPLTLEAAPILDPEPGALIARIDLGGICGTDVHLYHGNLPIPTPVILGHEAVGPAQPRAIACCGVMPAGSLKTAEPGCR